MKGRNETSKEWGNPRRQHYTGYNFFLIFWQTIGRIQMFFSINHLHSKGNHLSKFPLIRVSFLEELVNKQTHRDLLTSCFSRRIFNSCLSMIKWKLLKFLLSGWTDWAETYFAAFPLVGVIGFGKKKNSEIGFCPPSQDMRQNLLISFLKMTQTI